VEITVHELLGIIGTIVITAALLSCSIALWSLAPRPRRMLARKKERAG
jgi:hypothetical protein